MSLMYQEVCYTNITNDIIKGMKIESSNKWRKAETLNLDTSLDTSSTLAFIKIEWRTLTLAQHLSIYQAM